MKKTVFKTFYFWQYEKEEAWFNKMSEEGWQLTEARKFSFDFEQGTPGEYTYRVEFLDANPRSCKSQDYFSFLEEMNIECIGKCMRRVYLRQKSSVGTFENDNVLSSNVTRLIRIGNMFTVFNNAVLYTSFFSLLFSIILTRFLAESRLTEFFGGYLFGLGCGIFLCSVIFGPQERKNKRRLKQLLNELSLSSI